MIKTIIIIQDRPTQFDVPLYELITRKKDFNLIVYYTQTYLCSTKEEIDPEIECSPIWNHIGESSYDRRDLTEKETKNARLAAKRIAADQADLAVLSGYYPPLHAKLAILLRMKGIRIGLRSDNTIPHSQFSGVKGLLKHIILFNWLRLYDSWHPVGTLSHQYLKKISSSTKPTFLFPYNTSNNWFSDISSDYRARQSQLRQEWGLQPEDIVVLGVMKWHPREDPLTLIDSFQKLKQSIHTTHNVCLLLVGDGPLRNIVEKRLEGMREAVVLPGYVPYTELPLLYALSDIFVHPAINEPWGVSVSEAMACGLPVVASTGVGAGIDLIKEGQTGFTFPIGDIETLFKHLLKLTRNSALRHQLANNGKNLLADWSYEKTIENFGNALSYTESIDAT